jgi:CobQ-like glutamine amidotransferase family enzyme
MGVGNGTPDRTDGIVGGRVIGTYLHGPVLAQNPALADLLLGWVHGTLPPLDAPAEARVLRAARMRALDVGSFA